MEYTDKQKAIMETDPEWRPRRERIVCADGFSMSVQASVYAYCSPRINDAEYYTAVEVGYPSEQEELLMPHIEGYAKEGPTEDVYPWTPSTVVMNVILAHGGMVSGDLPPLGLNKGDDEE